MIRRPPRSPLFPYTTLSRPPPLAPSAGPATSSQSTAAAAASQAPPRGTAGDRVSQAEDRRPRERSEEHTSELQSLAYLVCRLLLEKKKKITQTTNETVHNAT